MSIIADGEHFKPWFYLQGLTQQHSGVTSPQGSTGGTVV